MKTESLPPSKKIPGRRNLSIFQGLNTFSFVLLTGNIMILYVMRLGGDNFFIGAISSFKYIAYLFMLVGYVFVKRTGVRKLMGICWIISYLFMLFLLVSPFIVSYGYNSAGLLLVFVALLGFHSVRGIGLVSFNPLIGSISEGKDRGAYLSRLQIIINSVAIAAGILIALFLGKEAPVSRYAVFIITGIVSGIGAVWFIFKLPDTGRLEKINSEGLVKGVKKAFKRSSFRKFIVLFFFISLLGGMALPFTIVYAKQVYLQPDRMIILYTVFGSLGSIVMGLLTRLLIDRLGAKPLYVFFTSFFLISFIPLLISPNFGKLMVIPFLGAVFFLFQLGMSGGQNAAQNYFFAVIDQTEHLTLGILYYFVFGIGGAIGSFLGGAVLHRIEFITSYNYIETFRIFFGVIFICIILALVFMSRLKRVGKYSVKNALSIIFSPRDMKAVTLLNKLEKTKSLQEETSVIEALAKSHSGVPVDDLVQKLSSPKYHIRSAVLLSLENLPADTKLEEALIKEVKNHAFTTAYIAARIIGKQNIQRGKNVLRASLNSSDYLLQAKSMVALGRLGDRDSIPKIEEIMKGTKNPMLIIHSATALDEFKSTGSIPILIETLKHKNLPPFLRDEIILSLSGIMGIGSWFYPFYSSFLEKAGQGLFELLGYLKKGYKQKTEVSYNEIITAVKMMSRNRDDFGREIKRLFNILKEHKQIPSFVDFLTNTVENPELKKLERFCFLLTAILVRFACIK